MKHFIFIGLAWLGFFSACSKSSSSDGTPQTTGIQSASSATPVQSLKLHFFSVAWGCVEVEKAKLDAASYTIKNFETQSGGCPATLTVVNATSKKLLECPVVIGPSSIPAIYILFDKRSLDGKTVSDLSAEGFTVDNFCPMIAQKIFN